MNKDGWAIATILFFVVSLFAAGMMGAINTSQFVRIPWFVATGGIFGWLLAKHGNA